MSLYFLPWLRDGLAASIRAVDGNGIPGRGQLAASLALSTGAHPDTQAVSLYGPGDVAGIEPSVVIRTDPVDGATGYETTRFVLAELSDAAVPWSFTPAAPDSLQRLRPWMTLVVVAVQDGVTLGPGSVPHTTVLTIAPPAIPATELPSATSQWAWAHVQVVAAAGETVSDALAASLPTSRLMCARALEPATTYLACLVPTFQSGAQAGLGQSVTADATLAPAWTGTESEITLPVYYSWSFITGEGGDFLTLASLLKGRPAPDGVGVRTLDLASVGGDTMSIGGALQRPGLSRESSPAEVAATLAAQVSGDDAEVRPPLYGAAYAGVARIDAQASGWLAECNVDPAMRVAAGLGASIVAAQQDTLVGTAWEQAGDVTTTNRLLDRGRLSQQVTQTLRDRHLSPLPDGVLLQVVGPGLDGVRMAESKTAGGWIRDLSTVPPATYSFAFTRLTGRAPLIRASVRAQLGRVKTSRAAAGLGLGVAGPGWIDAWGNGSGQRALLQQPPQSPPPAVSPRYVAIDGRFTADLRARLDASVTVPARVTSRVSGTAGPDGPDRYGPAPVQSAAAAVAPDAAHQNDANPAGDRGGIPADPLARALFGPAYPAPLYTALAQARPDLLLPGAELIEDNAVTLLEANSRFVAALLAGANSELGRELVWHGFPVDRRATYFQQFWDRSASGASSPDIPPMATWNSNASLDDLADDPTDQGLVLIIRGALLRRYPSTLVFAVADDGGGPSQLTDSDHLRQPVFSGSIAPDLRFFGFDLTVDEALGSDAHTGWFFAVQEQATETRFGFTDGADPLSGANANSATVAAATLRNPVEVLIHAHDLLAAP